MTITTVSSGRSVNDQTVARGDGMIVFGTAANTTVSGGGFISVSSGGIASDTTVLRGGMIEVMSGGVESGATLSSGTEIVSSGGVSLGAVLNGGLQTVRGMTRSASIYSGAEQDVYGSAVATQVGTFIDKANAVIEVGGAASKMTVYAQVEVYGKTTGTRVMGTETVETGGLVSASLVGYGPARNQPATEIVLSGGVANATSIYGKQILSSGGMAVSAALYDGVQSVLSGGFASATAISGDGLSMPSQVVAGGTAVSTVLKAGFGGGGVAQQIVTAGGHAIDTTLVGGAKGIAEQIIASGGVASGTIIGKNRDQFVYAGGIASRTVVRSGGLEILNAGGHADRTVVQSGGDLSVSAGGITVSAVIKSGGVEVVSSGGKASMTTLAGGTERVLSGGVIGGAVSLGGAGRLIISGTSKIAPSLNGFAATDTLDLASFAHQAGETLSFVENSANAKGVLTLTDGALKATVILFGQYTAAGFHAVGDGQGGTAITYETPAHSAHALAEVAASPT